MFRILGGVFLSILFTAGAYAADDVKSAFTQGEVTGEFRSFFYVRDYDQSTKRQDLASGGMLYYQTAPLKGISAGIAFYTGQDLGLNDSDNDVYGLLAKDENGDHDSFTVLGEAYLQAEFSDTTLKLGRQELETPFVNGDDNRLTPQATEGFTLVNKSIPGVTLTASYVAKMRGKTSTEFVSMTEYAEIADGDEPVILGGLVYDGIEDLTLQVWDFHAVDFMNEFYLRGDFSLPLSNDWAVFGSAQYLSQRDTGEMLGGPQDTYTYGIEVGIEGKGLQASFGYGAVGKQDIIYPWGHDFIVSLMVNDLSRAEENGTMGVVKYNFDRIGIPGLVGRVRHLAFDTPESGENASYDFSETDLEVFYTFGGQLDGMNLKIRHAIVNKDEALGGDDYGDTRIMLSYKFNLN
jgi:hypothetical protein